jgi:phasin family protein
MTTKSTNSGQNFFESMAFQMPSFDHESGMKMYRKNIEATAQAQKVLLDMAREITSLNSEYGRQMMEEMRDHHKDLIAAQSLEERAQLTADKFKHQLDHLLSHGREMADIWTKSCNSFGEKLQARYQESMKEAKDIAQKQKS